MEGGFSRSTWQPEWWTASIRGLVFGCLGLWFWRRLVFRLGGLAFGVWRLGRSESPANERSTGRPRQNRVEPGRKKVGRKGGTTKKVD